MAVRIDNSADGLMLNAGLPAYNAFATGFWFYMSVDRNLPGPLLFHSNADGTLYHGLYLGSNGTTLTIDSDEEVETGSDLTVGAWNYLFFQRVGDNYECHLNGVSNITLTNPVTFTPAFWIYGTNSVNFVNGRFAAMKAWSGIAALFTADQIAAEMRTYRPQRYANLHGWWPGFPGATERLRDYSANGRTFTALGTLTDEDGPPIGWGAPVVVLPFAAAGGGGGHAHGKIGQQPLVSKLVGLVR
jgi:hypothetical protein